MFEAANSHLQSERDAWIGRAAYTSSRTFPHDEKVLDSNAGADPKVAQLCTSSFRFHRGIVMSRILVPSTSPFAPVMGFSRVVRVGNHLSVGGTAPIDTEGNTVGLGDPAVQVRQCFETIESCLLQAGASMSDVVRTRM